jgi:hypothetical protein
MQLADKPVHRPERRVPAALRIARGGGAAMSNLSGRFRFVLGNARTPMTHRLAGISGGAILRAERRRARMSSELNATGWP